jgi:hypothetical protein
VSFLDARAPHLSSLVWQCRYSDVEVPDTLWRHAVYHDALLAGQLAYAVADVAAALRGKNLACWCRTDAPCHADVLLQVANTSAISLAGRASRRS